MKELDFLSYSTRERNLVLITLSECDTRREVAWWGELVEGRGLGGESQAYHSRKEPDM